MKQYVGLVCFIRELFIGEREFLEKDLNMHCPTLLLSLVRAMMAGITMIGSVHLRNILGQLEKFMRKYAVWTLKTRKNGREYMGQFR